MLNKLPHISYLVTPYLVTHRNSLDINLCYRFALLFLWSEKILGLTFGKIKDRLKELLFYLKVLKDTGQSSQKLAESLKTIKLENGFFKRVDIPK